MRTVTLYIAMSLDGYIADRNGAVNWLHGHGDDKENIDTYSQFINNMDTVIMGWNTYHQITAELSPKQWVYQDLTSYVITHRELPSTDKIKFVKDNPCEIVRSLKQQQGKGIWICGGSSMIQPLIQDGLIDEYYISVIPTILGSGIRLFGEITNEIKLRLVRTQAYNGIVELIYTCR